MSGTSICILIASIIVWTLLPIKCIYILDHVNVIVLPIPLLSILTIDSPRIMNSNEIGKYFLVAHIVYEALGMEVLIQPLSTHTCVFLLCFFES